MDVTSFNSVAISFGVDLLLWVVVYLAVWLVGFGFIRLCWLYVCLFVGWSFVLLVFIYAGLLD